MCCAISFAATAFLLAGRVLSAPRPVKAQIAQINEANTSSIPTQSYNQSVFESLVLARSAVDRDNLLDNDDTVFAFVNPCRNTPELGGTIGDGGKLVRADHSTFPALVGSGGSITMGFLNPCGFNTPHVHPRAGELIVVVEGRLFTSVTAENRALHRNHTLNQYEMTVFPQGAIHTNFNPDCTPAVFVAAFPDEDPGVGQVAQNYFGLEDEIVLASAGGDLAIDGANIDAWRNNIPVNVVKGVESCLTTCGIKKR
ncbi:spherulin-1A [Hyaloscypha hepaticicola]|uniref:Spherulin-1A n=1 Tax=Hyaloscypha hepaticicola TaxID=2082293 RepID=A0A2J6Q7X0_9HELO|nr:spherulin-1A [Hyaloscypha hepaticicola]